MSASMKRVCAAFLLAAAMLVTGQARADERSEAREHYNRGTKDFELGLYDDAVTEYMAAYKLRDDPALLYNIAQAHRLAGNAREALRFYKVFVHKIPDDPNRKEVDDRIVELQKLVDQENAAKNRPPDQPRELQPESLRSPPELVAAPVAPSSSWSRDAERLSARRMKIAGAVSAGVGVALLATGIALGVVAQNAGDSLSAINAKGGTFDPSLESKGKSDQLASAVLLGVGGAATIAGAIVLGLGVRHSRKLSKRALLVPVVTPHLAGASLTLPF